MENAGIGRPQSGSWPASLLPSSGTDNRALAAEGLILRRRTIPQSLHLPSAGRRCDRERRTKSSGGKRPATAQGDDVHASSCISSDAQGTDRCLNFAFRQGKKLEARRTSAVRGGAVVELQETGAPLPPHRLLYQRRGRTLRSNSYRTLTVRIRDVRCRVGRAIHTITRGCRRSSATSLGGGVQKSSPVRRTRRGRSRSHARRAPRHAEVCHHLEGNPEMSSLQKAHSKRDSEAEDTCTIWGRITDLERSQAMGRVAVR